MMPVVDVILLVGGIVVPLTIFGRVLLFHRRRYRSWARLVALFGSIAALTWGVSEAFILYSYAPRHTLSQLVASRRAAASFVSPAYLACCLVATESVSRSMPRRPNQSLQPTASRGNIQF
jgi:hypothetical protein